MLETGSKTSSEPQRFFVVGDIHGCPRQLEEILNKAQAYPRHKMVFLGDYIDRGPDPETVLQMLRTIDGIFLMGNHEQMLIDRWRASSAASARGWLDLAHVSLDSFEWIRSVAIDQHETADYLFVHGDKVAETPKTVIHGHHSVDKPIRVGNRINLNTRCGAGGPLTALVIPEFLYVQSSASPQPRAKPSPTPADFSALADEGLEEL